MLDGGDIKTQRALLTLQSISVRAGETMILSGIDLALGTGRPTMLMGPNGSGKTTLLRVMMGLTAPCAGRISGIEGSRRAFVFQRPVMLKRSARDNVTFALRAAGQVATGEHAAALLGRVGLAHVAERPARKLSGGEQQRLALARALARQPDIVFLDEPTASLDPAQTKIVEEIIAGVAAAGVKVIMATHDPGQARRLAGDLVFLVRGRIVEHAAATNFFNQPRTDAARRFLAGDLVI